MSIDDSIPNLTYGGMLDQSDSASTAGMLANDETQN